jgi:CheY-like chemotaxis protein
VRCFGSARALAGAQEEGLPSKGPHAHRIDRAMPGEDGFEALRRARSIELACGNDRYTPAIALTAFTQIERERLMAAGFVDRVDKPVDADRLITAIRAALRTEQRARVAAT